MANISVIVIKYRIDFLDKIFDKIPWLPIRFNVNFVDMDEWSIKHMIHALEQFCFVLPATEHRVTNESLIYCARFSLESYALKHSFVVQLYGNQKNIRTIARDIKRHHLVYYEPVKNQKHFETVSCYCIPFRDDIK